MAKEIFYVEFPTFRYEEDAKAVAAKNGLRIVDAAFQGKNEQCKNVPKLTLKKEFKPIKKDK